MKGAGKGSPIVYSPGQEINGFVVISQSAKIPYKSGQWFYDVRCAKCGSEFTRPSQFLRKKKLRSCKNCRSFSAIIGGAANHVFRQYRNNATESGRDFELSPLEFKNLILRSCHYCGRLPSQIKTMGKDVLVYNGVDRVNNDQGYTVSNTVPCCKPCNMAKKVTPKDEFLGWVDRVYRYQHESELVTYAIGH